MKPLFSDQKQKLVSIVIATAVSFLGFEILSYILGATYQLNYFSRVSVAVYLFHLFWLTFLFDLHFKKRGILGQFAPNTHWLRLLLLGFRQRVLHVLTWKYFRHYVNFLILPSVLYWSVVLLMSINPFESELKQALILFSSAGLAVVYWYLKDIYSKNFELHHTGVKLLSLVKVYTSFVFYAAVVGQTFYFGMGPGFLFLTVAIVTFLLVYQALFQHHFLGVRALLFPSLAIALVLGAVSYWIYGVWSYQYLTAAVLMAAVYNTCWGLFHHYLDKNLSRRLAFEYLLILFLALSILLTTGDFGARIG
jgi:hypothetical protein